jgi:type IV pilus assembly protein PilF
LHRAQRLDPSNRDVQFLLANICYRGGRYDEARRRIEELQAASASTAEATWLLLRIARKTGDRETESRYATQIRREFKNSQEYQQLMQGDFE